MRVDGCGPNSVINLFKLKIYTHISKDDQLASSSGNTTNSFNLFFISAAVKVKNVILQKLNSSSGIKIMNSFFPYAHFRSFSYFCVNE